MKKLKEAHFTKQYNRIMVLTFFAVFSLATALIVAQTLIEIQNYEEQLEQSFDTKTLAIDNLVGNVANHLNLMQEEAESYFLDTPALARTSDAGSLLHDSIRTYTVNTGVVIDASTTSMATAVPALLSALPTAHLLALTSSLVAAPVHRRREISHNVFQSPYFNLDAVPMPYSIDTTANLTGLGDIDSAPQALKEELEMSLSLNSLFTATKNNIRDAEWVYYTSKQDFLTIAPWVVSTRSRFGKTMHSEEFYTLGLPDTNPDRQIRWTAVYEDHFGKGLMVTAVKPVYRSDEFLGTVAIDITLNDLEAMVAEFGNTADPLLLMHEDTRQLITHPTVATGDEVDLYLDDVIQPALAQDIQGLLAETSRTAPDAQPTFASTLGYRLISKDLENAPWVVFYAEPERTLSAVFSGGGIVFITLLASLGLMLVVMKRATFREFINPAENLVRHIALESQGTASADHDAPRQWLPWFRKISTTFEHNRSLIREVNEKNEQLTDMNISLERYMPKFILLINIDKGCGGTTVGNFFADTLARNNPSKHTVYLEFPHASAVHESFALDPAQHTHRHPNGYDILSEFDLGEVPDEAMSSLLMTKVLHHYNNIVVNATLEEPTVTFIDSYLEPMFRYAKAIVLMLPPDAADNSKVTRISNRIKKHVHLGETQLYTMVNTKADTQSLQDCVDFTIPFLGEDFRISEAAFDVPPYALSATNKIVNMVERVHQLAIYIPTTVDVDRPIDTGPIVQQTMTYLGELFGGATSSEGQGVWNSESSGIVNETVYIVVTYTTEGDLEQYLDRVIDYVKDIRTELQQEAMAIEINKKMSFV